MNEGDGGSRGQETVVPGGEREEGHVQGEERARRARGGGRRGTRVCFPPSDGCRGELPRLKVKHLSRALGLFDAIFAPILVVV